MSNSNWILELKAAGIILALMMAAIVTTSFIVPVPDYGYYRKSKNAEGAYRDNSHTLSNARSNNDGSVSYRRICENPKTESDDDLCQQWRMAEAAQDAVLVSKIQAVIGAIGLAGLVLTVFYAARAAEAAAASARVAERSMVELERALVLPVGFRVDVLIGPRREVIGFKISVDVTNTGNTIAKKVVGTANIVVFDHVLPKDFRFPDRLAPDKSTTAIGRGVQIVFPLDIAFQDIVDIQQKRRSGYVYGWLEYDDIFSATAKRRTEYCVEIEVIGDPTVIPEPSSSPNLAFKAYGPYNGTDEDCFYKPGQSPPIGGLPAPTQPPRL